VSSVRVSSLQRSKASAKDNGVENVSRCDWAVKAVGGRPRHELHAVKKLRRLQHVELAEIWRDLPWSRGPSDSTCPVGADLHGV
jgi:hypothetical protein